jgi:hypothetical protein
LPEEVLWDAVGTDLEEELAGSGLVAEVGGDVDVCQHRSCRDQVRMRPDLGSAWCQGRTMHETKQMRMGCSSLLSMKTKNSITLFDTIDG